MKIYAMCPDPCVCGHEPACCEVWMKESDGFDLLQFLQNDSPEVFAAACFLS